MLNTRESRRSWVTPRACPWVATCPRHRQAGRPAFLVVGVEGRHRGGNLDRIQIIKGWLDR